MIRSIIIGVLAIGLVGTGIWGYQEHQEKEILAITAENNYQRAFHELAFHVDQIEHELGTTLAMNSREQLSPALAEVWRLTSLAHSEVGQLPLGLMDLTKVDEFLYNLGEFSYRASIRDLDKEPLTQEEYEKVEKLKDLSHTVQEELRTAQAELLKNDMRWLNIEQEMMAQEKPLNNSVINSFQIVNDKVGGFSETEWGPGHAKRKLNDEEIAKRLDGKEISSEEAKQIALDYAEVPEGTEVLVDETGKGLDYGAYTLTINDPDHEADYFMDITKAGGHPIWFIQHREIKDQKISLNEASKKAKEFLEKHGKENMQLVDSRQYDSIGVFNFAHMIDDIRVYSDNIVLEVALDDGDVIGYEAMDYLLNHSERERTSPKLNIEQAKDRLNPKVEVMEDHLAIIKNEQGEDVLCYEFYGVIKNDTYRIFINADTGAEEQVKMLDNAEPVY